MPRRKDVKLEPPAATARAQVPTPAPTRLWVGDRGWVRVEYARAAGRERLLAHVRPDEGGMLRVRDLTLLDVGEPVTVERLRAVRLGTIERLVNHPAHRAAILQRFDSGEPLDLEAASRRFTAATTRAGRRRRSTPAVLERPVRGYGDEHYEAVAAAYVDAEALGEPPVLAVAAHWGVPRPTAGRWVKEARRRGLLEAYYARGRAGA